jgi:Domain of unknown function (DUF4129)
VTGSNDRSWNSLDRVVAPTLLALIEAAWISTWVGALWHVSPTRRIDLPFLAVALVATMAIALASLVGIGVPGERIRRVLRMLAAVVIAVLAAGVIGVLYLHGSFLAFGLHPWTVPAGAASSEAAAAWFVAVIAVVRGTWLGSSELGRRHVASSLTVTTIAFVVFFFVAVTHRGDAAIAREVGAAEVLLLVAFPCAIALLAVVSERELERTSLRGQLSRPSFAWLGAVLVPMAGVGAIAVALAVGVRPLFLLVADVVRKVALWVLDVLDDVLGRIASMIHLSKRAPQHVVTGSGGGRVPHEVPGRTPTWIAVLAIAVAVLFVAAAIVLAVRLARKLIRRRRPRRATTVQLLDEERGSVFSWSHLLDQLLGVFRRWRDRRVDTEPAAAGVPVPAFAGAEGPASVRGHYRRLLAAAKAAGHPRRAFETPLELESRLAPLSDEADARALAGLTDIYDAVRYGGHLESSDDVTRAGAATEAFAAALLEVSDPELSYADLDTSPD